MIWNKYLFENVFSFLGKTEFKLIKVKNIMNKEWGLHYINFYCFALFPKGQEIINMEWLLKFIEKHTIDLKDHDLHRKLKI